MPSQTSHVLAASLALSLAAGCTQYLGYRVDKTTMDKRTRVLESGKPRAIEVHPYVARATPHLVAVHVLAASRDRVATIPVVQQHRIYRYGRYSPTVDFVWEPCQWVLGLFSPVLAITRKDARWFYSWPPIDLFARLFGSHGWNYRKQDRTFVGQPYEAHAPGYGRRLAQWFAWLLPFYSFGELTKDKPAVVETPGAEQVVLKPQKSPAAGARVSVTASTSPGKPLHSTADANGVALFDLRPVLGRLQPGQRFSITAQAEWHGIKGSAKASAKQPR